MSGYRELGWPDYLVEAAAEAREASARYWAPGGYADRKYPKHPIPDEWWPLADQPALDNQTGIITQDRASHAASVAGKMLRATSLDPRFVAALLYAWNLMYCRPPISEARLDRIFTFIAQREIARLEDAA